MNTEKMPLVFIGHGSPMNAIEQNTYTKSWEKIGKSIPRPRAILILSAHWITEWETHISTGENPSMIYDMYGFPPPLYQIQYPAAGNTKIALEILRSLTSALPNEIFRGDTKRGFDHGVWSTLIHMFPKADVPVICLSLDYHKTPEWHYNLGKALKTLRSEWILIMGSGNIVHNLRMIDWAGKSTWHDWAIDFDARMQESIENGNMTDILTCLSWESSHLAHPTHDHLLPLFPLLGAVEPTDTGEFFTPDIVMWSLSMRSIVWR